MKVNRLSAENTNAPNYEGGGGGVEEASSWDDKGKQGRRGETR